MVELARYEQDGATRARRLAEMPEGDLRRVAIEAVQSGEVQVVWCVVEGHMLTHGKVSRHTLKNRRGGLASFMTWARERGVNLLRPGRNVGESYVRALEAAGYAPLTVRSRIAAARGLYRALRWAGATEANPFEETKAPKDAIAAWDKREAYEPDEVEAMLGVVNTEERALLLLYAHAGLRAAEALALEWRDIDLKRGELIVREGKGGKTAKVALSRSLGEALRTLRGTGGGGRLFPIDPATAWRRFRKVAERAGVQYRGLHAFRHYAGTRLAIESDGNLGTVARHLRHSGLDTARIYVHMGDQQVRRAVGEW